MSAAEFTGWRMYFKIVEDAQIEMSNKEAFESAKARREARE